MKKILGVAVGLVVVYGAASFSLGFLAEKSMNEQVEYFNKTAGAMNGLKLEVSNYSRGLLSSSADVKIALASPGMPIPLEFKSHSKIQHGPVLTIGGFGFGAYATESTLQIDLADEEANKQLKEFFGDSIGLITAHYAFDKSYDGEWKLDALKHSKDDTEFTMDASSMTFSGEWDTKKMQAQFNIGAIKLKDLTTDIQIDPFVGQSTQYQVAEGLPITNMDLSSAKMVVTTPNLPMPITLENLKIAQAQVEDGKNIDTKVSFTLDKITGPVEVKNAYYNIEFNNLPVEGMLALQKSFSSLNGAADPMATQMLLMESLPKILVEGVEFKLGLGSDYMDGKATADFGLVYHAPKDGTSLMEQAPDQMLALFSANLDMIVSESIINTIPFAEQLTPMVGTYVTQENGAYKLNAALKDSQLTVGNQVIPPEQYMSVLMLAAMGMSAGGDVPADEPAMEEGYSEGEESYTEGEESASEAVEEVTE